MKGDSSKVTIIEPGMVQAINGEEYFNPQRIIAGHPDDVASYNILKCRGCPGEGQEVWDCGGCEAEPN